MSKPLKDQLSHDTPRSNRLCTSSCFSSSYIVLSLICDHHKGVHKSIHSSTCFKYLPWIRIFLIRISPLSSRLMFSKSTWHLHFFIRYHKYIKTKRVCPSKNFPQINHTWFLLSDPLFLIWPITNYSWLYLQNACWVYLPLSLPLWTHYSQPPTVVFCSTAIAS